MTKQLLYGVAYYDEYMPYDRLDQDIAMMLEAGINVVRIAESTWSTLEPQNNVFNFHHIDRVLEAMHQAGISVIIGTPTYAVPTWMVKAHPEVLATTPKGKNIYGPRQNMDISNPTYLFYAERVIRRLMEHVQGHPAIIGYQVDNETKYYQTCGDNVIHGFIKYMRETYRDLDTVNKAFGLDYWSNRINSWEDFPSPVGTINASLAGAFATYQRKLVTDFLQWQADIVREYKKEDQWVTHNFDFEWRGYSFGIQPDVDHFQASQALDVVGVDIYHPSQGELTGVEIAFCGDVARSLKQDNYFVIETEAQGFAAWVPYPEQLRLQAFSHLASGANMVSYWHWHSIHNACETYWKGLLSHDFKSNPTFEEAKTIGRDFKRLSSQLINIKKDNSVAIMVSNEALTAFNAFKYNTGGMDYNDVVRRYYDGLYQMNLGCDFIRDEDLDISKYKLLIVPALYAVSDETLNRLNKYVKAGGHIVYGLRTGFCDKDVKVRHDVQPGIISEACGVTYNQFVEAKGVKLQGGIDPLNYWIELLTPTTAAVLASFDHPYWGQYAAITHNCFGLGEVTYMGCLPSESDLKGYLVQVVKNAGLWNVDQEIAFPIITRKGMNDSGKTVHYYFNYSMETQSFNYPYPAGEDLISGEKVEYLSTCQLNPWGLLVVEED